MGTVEQIIKFGNSKLLWAEEKHKVPFFEYYWPETVEVRGFPKSKVKVGEEWNGKFLQACVAEFIAMMFFIIMCCGCAMVTLKDERPNLMMVAASFGFGIMCLAQFVGPLSGGHINCAVSLSTARYLDLCILHTLCAVAFW